MSIAIKTLLAPSVSLADGAMVGAIETDSLQNHGGESGVVSAFPAAMPLSPLPPASTPGASNVTVQRFQDKTLTPGAYAAVKVAGTLRLEPGTYSFGSVTLEEGARLLAEPGSVEVRVDGALVAEHHTVIASVNRDRNGDDADDDRDDDAGRHRGQELPASNFFISVSGDQGASIGANSRIQLLLEAPHGTLSLAHEVRAAGAFSAFDISLGDEVVAVFQSGFSPETAYPHGTQTIAGEVPSGISAGTVLVVGTLPRTTIINLAIGLPLTNQAALDTFIQQLSDPKSPKFRKYLTPEQFAAAYGPPQSDYDDVVNFAAPNDLSVLSTYKSRGLLAVTGTAAAIEKAFFVTLNRYQRPDGTLFYAPANDPSANLDVSILHITGLDNFAVPHRAGGSGPSGCPLNPAENTYVGTDFRTAYLPCTTLDGTGQAIALFEADSYFATDPADYVTNFLPGVVPNLTNEQVPHAAPTFAPGGGESEVALDIEMLLAVASKAHIYVYEQNPNSFNPDIILAEMADDNFAKVISSSWTWTGSVFDPMIANIFQQFAAEGTSFFQASGDLGAYIPSGPRPNVQEPIIDTSLMTVVGGTQLTTTATTAYISETTWNDPFFKPGNSVSGGGFCTGYAVYPTLPIPSYQLNINPSNAEVNSNPLNARMIPDVSMIADQIVIFASNGTESCSGGTSAAAPLWAGIAALINQESVVGPIGFTNPALYNIAAASPASYAANFNDINDGSNNNFSGTGLYHAFAGYDLATGLGSPKATCNLLHTVPPQSCMPGTSLSAVISSSGANVTAYVPNGSYSELAKGVSVYAIEGSGPRTTIATPDVVNTCAGNSLTQEVVCTANNTDVYLINGTTATLTSTLTSAGTQNEAFSGGNCKTCNVAVDPLHNQAYLSIGTATGAAFQPLNLATSTLGTPIPAGQPATSEDILVDTLRGFVLSPSESNNFQLLNPTTGNVFNFSPPGGALGGEFDGAAEDCTTGIAISSVEFVNQLLLVDITQATFSGSTWTAPSSFQTIPEFAGFSFGTGGIAIAPNSHLGVVAGEFGGNQFGAIVLPSASGSGTPALVDWVAASLPNTPDGRPWSMGRDPHTLTAYTSPTSGKQYAIFEDDVNQNGTRTFLAIVDLQALLQLPRIAAHTATIPASAVCEGVFVNPAGCLVRFVP